MSDIIKRPAETQLPPGIYRDLPRADYDALEAINATQLVAASISGRLWRRRCTQNFSGISEPLIRGRAFAVKCEDPEGWLNRVEIGPTKTVTAKAFVQAIEDTDKDEVILEAHVEQVEAMYQAISEHPVAGALWESDKEREITLVWNCPRTGQLMKARLDWLFPEDGYHVDLKTSGGLSPWSVEASIKRYSYALRMAHYRDGICSTGLDEFGTKYQHLLIFVEPETSYPEVIVRELSTKELDEQRTWIDKGVQNIMTYRKDGIASWMVPDLLRGEEELEGFDEVMDADQIKEDFING